jgi:hypothetical protein
MEKPQRTKEELEALVLAELHAEPQCEGVLHVTVISYDDPKVPATWEVASFNPGTSDQVKCEQAVSEIVKRLQQDFDIAQ